MMNEKIVEFSGAVVNSHLSKSRICFSLITLMIITSIKRSLLLGGRGHPLQSPFFIVLFLYLTVTESGTVQIKLRMIFQVILNTCFSPKIKVS